MGVERGRGFIRYQLPALVWALLIFVSSSIPGTDFPRVNFPHVDKVVHFCYYFTFTILTARAFKFQPHFTDLSRFSITLSFLVATAYGVLDEVHQMFVPYRSPDPLDLYTDIGGAFLAVVALWFWQKRGREREGSGGIPPRG
jgi:VanZ family protein